MKKILILITALILSLSVLASCEFIDTLPLPDIGLSGEETNPGEIENDGSITPEVPDEGGNQGEAEKPDDNQGDKTDEPDASGSQDGEDTTPGEGGNQDGEDTTPGEGGNQDGGSGEADKPTYLYTDFTANEKALFTELCDKVIPFVPNNEYYVEDWYLDWEDDAGTYEEGLNFCTYGNTQAEYDAYRVLFNDYNYDGTDTDDYGDSWYFYSDSDGLCIDMCYYPYGDDYVIDVYVYYVYVADEGVNEGEGGSGSGSDSGSTNPTYIYTDFTDKEKDFILDFLGELIPFVPNNEYYVDTYTDDNGDDWLNFYTYGNTEKEFMSFFTSFDGYTLNSEESVMDEDGDMWYCLENDEIYVIVSYYYYGGDYVIDLYAYNVNGNGNTDDGSEGGNGSGSGSEGESGSEGGSEGDSGSDSGNEGGSGSDSGNEGDSDGDVYNVDFTKAENVKNVTDQGYYLDGCPTVGSPKVLVIPVEFSDATAQSKGYTVKNIVEIFTGSNTDYYSVDEYYYISSYGKLDLDITVVDNWFKPKYASTYYKTATVNLYGEEYELGDQLLMDEALAYLAGIMDLSEYDSDGNGIIDAVVMVNTLTIDSESSFNWAYRYWNYYTDDDGYYYEYDGVSANDYVWVPYAFMHEKYDSNGDATYTDTDVMNPYTFIHEFGHVLGADDYYDTEYTDTENLLAGCDVMDAMAGDHNAYTKFNLGWITTSRLVTTNSSVTLTLDAFSKNGDTIIIANNWDESLGAYQEYYIVVYYTMDGLNGSVNGYDYGYFSRDGIIVYHVNSALYAEEYNGELLYDVYNNNTTYTGEDGYGTKDNLIEFIKSGDGNFTYVEGDSLPTQTDDLGSKLAYSFTVDSLTSDTVTITFTKN